MQQPNKFPKRVLLAVSGMSPQIVTETLYSLVTKQTEPFIPTEIHLITTQSGAQQAKLQLLDENSGKFWQLCKDYCLPEIRFPEKNIHVIEDSNGLALDDIKTPEQNEAAADFITAIVSKLTRDDDASLHVSIAGGRKTMGYYLGYALSLYGRAQDRLSHVLVTDRYESLKDFFYPTPDSHVIHDKDNHALNAKDAEVMLAEIPFVRLRGGIPPHLLEGKTTFSESIKFVRQIEQAPQLRIDTVKRCFWVSDIKVAPQEVNFIFYRWLLERSIKGDPVKRLPSDNNSDYAREFLAFYAQNVNEAKDGDRTQKALEGGMPNQWISERISLIKRSFENSLGKHAAQPFIVQSTGNNNNRQYHIALTEEQITFVA
ncbi:CRISPR-associated ring nuclease Csm6 [Methylomarinum sp. Ch1-1]|uniref:CRISPR-associated ring nuclease Csm6 n=1 Tax=Methylomarinum roseum TaxID=3067653 RepID=A0AAU7NZP9_9GAMM|nr:CRISPR-associated ring nuclease Csm6 [Methylomarinum sp. Ch1-1]MDP4521430.1 CRISPR-associated ring nuclease Csm6 [Methylomarinum sp. Ch1-1]